ncbi:hydroxymethylglutaryl-CoA reductase, degradative [Halosimplex pelagicum]|uniref:3-hydroxy-3-methylglutaryl coenzyme A reductase n=1 Tax=Halosimplex pelagicum TaxID=869886 RepID=A0A7D5T607_9EURY|nr:hydroxymethylglutaryl-CoA reductase, degradative [Halosimplex pelagicum]QLH82828.1 hydroxymethylglutaryl-CoA reductase, degradative [Halosimplex pelagicum]
MNSRIPGFYTRDRSERLSTVADRRDLDADAVDALDADGEVGETVDGLSENVVGSITYPLSVATNFVVDGEDVLVPMAVEESSVVAAASKGALLARSTGGFTTDTDGPYMIGQVQVADVADPTAARLRVLERAEEIAAVANDQGVLVSHGGGCEDVTARVVDTPAGQTVVVHLLVDVRDAMGANAVNTMCEAIAPVVADATGGRVSLRVLSNLADCRLARARCRVDPDALVDSGDDSEEASGIDGETVRDRIVEAWAFAAGDPYRAATHNKGIMNAVDALAVATCNDWRALEAGAHAYAAREGYGPLTTYEVGDDGDLICSIELPVQVGTVGGATAVHSAGRAAMDVLGVEGADEFASVLAALGLAENLASLRALVDEGIQSGHMKLHAENVARQAGAPAGLVEEVAARMVAGEDIRESRARELVEELG